MLSHNKIYVDSKRYLIENIEYAEVDSNTNESISAYFNLIYVLKAAKENNLKRIEVLSYSIMIDELNGICNTSHGQLQDIIFQDLIPYFIEYRFTKVSEEKFNRSIKNNYELSSSLLERPKYFKDNARKNRAFENFKRNYPR